MDGHSLSSSAAALAVVGSLALAQGCMCSPSESPGVGGQSSSGNDGGAGASTTTTSTPSTTTSSSEDPCETPAGCAPEPAPDPQPCPGWPGWETWDDFAPMCPLCVPASIDALPPPIAWEPCDPRANMPVGCRQMAVSWPAPYPTSPFSYAASVDVRSDGEAVLDITRISATSSDPWRMNVVAEADGAVLSAMVDPRRNAEGCSFAITSVVGMSQGTHAFRIIDGDMGETFPEAIVGGAVDELHPEAQWLWQRSGGRGVAASDRVWATWDSVNIGIAKWGEPWQVVFSGTQAGGLQQVQARAWHEFVTWETGSSYDYAGAMAWTPARGAYPFITFPGDWSRGVEGLGTDGVQMVWTYGEGKSSMYDPYPIRSVMVSPFTTDPAQLQPTRLRSYPTPEPGIVPWAVGCGHAAHHLEADQVLVVRLSDGWSWILSSNEQSDAGPLDQWYFYTVYALTCEEVFLRGGVGTEMNIARVRLDALGPGMPPD